MNKWKRISAIIIDEVENAIRVAHPKIEIIASKLKGNTLLYGAVYYNLEDRIADILKRECK